jgi:hypothetical protein
MKLTPEYSTLLPWSVVDCLTSDDAYLDDDMARFDLWEGDLRFLYHFGAAIFSDGDGVDLGRVCHGYRTC